MDVVTVTGPVNFRDLVQSLDLGLYVDMGDGSGELFVDLPDLGLYATVTIGWGRSNFTIFDETGTQVATISVDGPIDFSASRIGLTEVLYTPDTPLWGLPGKIYSVQDPDAQMSLFATDDTVIISAGKVNAAAGDDTILALDTALEANADGSLPALGSGDRVSIKGGAGNDTARIEHLNVDVNLGDGADEITLGWGKALAHGGAGADRFIIDTTMSDRFGSQAEADMGAFFFVRDFKSGEDRFIFRTQGATQEASLADLFAGETLADMAPVVEIGGLTLTFEETQNGDALLTRTGVTADGFSVDETVRFKKDGLNDIALTDVNIFYDEL